METSRQQNKPTHPVILAVPAAEQHLKGREKVVTLSRYARQALALSARYTELQLGELKKDPKGAPIPRGGVFWSLTHKSAMVGAVAATEPVGIDLERIRPYSRGLYNRLAGQKEWDLAPFCDDNLFFRYWTAKEAVLKAVGKGLTGLSDCSIAKIVDASMLIVNYRQTRWTVVHHWIGRHHVAAVTIGSHPVRWHIAVQTG